MEVGAGLATAPENTLAYGRFGQIILYISARGAPSASDWAHYIAWFRSTVKRGSDVVSFVYERSPGPNASQRKQLTEATAGCNLRAAVLATSAVIRTMITAFNWFQKDAYKAFSPEQIDEALVFLGLPRALVPEARKTVQQLIDALDGPK